MRQNTYCANHYCIYRWNLVLVLQTVHTSRLINKTCKYMCIAHLAIIIIRRRKERKTTQTNTMWVKEPLKDFTYESKKRHNYVEIPGMQLYTSLLLAMYGRVFSWSLTGYLPCLSYHNVFWNYSW